MKKLNFLLAAAALLFSTQIAQAQNNDQVQTPVYTCSLSFDVQGGGIRVFVGSFKLKGPGQITCVDFMGNTEVIPVKVSIGAAPLAFSIGIGRMHVLGFASGIGLAGQPSDLLGHYLVGSVRGSLLVGAGADLALHAADRALTLNAAVQAVSGAGVSIGFDHLTISAQ